LSEQAAAKSGEDLAALTPQDDDLPPLSINFGPLPASMDIAKMRIHRVGDHSLHGWKLGKTLGEVVEVIRRKKAEED